MGFLSFFVTATDSLIILLTVLLCNTFISLLVMLKKSPEVE